jgi:hypothetical protein
MNLGASPEPLFRRKRQGLYPERESNGRKRQIREMGRLTGLPVVRIIRVRIGSLQLGNLKSKQWRHLNPDEVSNLKGKIGSQSGRKNALAKDHLRSENRFLPHHRIERKLCPHHQSWVHTVMIDDISDVFSGIHVMIPARFRKD